MLLLCSFVSIASSSAYGQPYSYATHKLVLTDLGAGVTPTAINNPGQVVGQDASGEAFLWTAGVMLPLGTLDGSDSYANDINDSGVVVGWSHDGNEKQKAFKWEASVMTNIGGTSTTIENVAEAINTQGDIIGWRTSSTAYRASLWNEANPAGVALFNTNGDTKGFGINDAGYVVGITLDPGAVPDEGYYWDGITGGGTSYTSQMDANYFPYAGINQNNLTAGIQGGEASFLEAGDVSPESAGKLVLTDAFSIANGLNDLSQIVGESDGKGFLYELATDDMFDLNLFPRLTPGFGQVLRLNDLNNDGTFTGVALVDGIEHGFVGQLVPVPEPGSFVMISSALLAFAYGLFRRDVFRPVEKAVTQR